MSAKLWRSRCTLNYFITECTGNSISWRQDAVEKASTQHREPSRPLLISLEIRWVGEKMLEWEHVLTSRLHFWNSQAVTIGFSRVYSNCFCSCSFQLEIIKIGQLSHMIYSNNILNFEMSTAISNACTKIVWKLIEVTDVVAVNIFCKLFLFAFRFLCYIYTYIYMSRWLFTSLCWGFCYRQRMLFISELFTFQNSKDYEW